MLLIVGDHPVEFVVVDLLVVALLVVAAVLGRLTLLAIAFGVGLGVSPSLSRPPWTTAPPAGRWRPPSSAACCA
ncbi:hypothetical protein [Kribbella sp. NPDC050470]|uniref:hypothetical protein n=1 Tax=unclassified Kribbella TaxID=2644121 RepID=UPI0037AD0574